MQIGWATQSTRFSLSDRVGDEITSFAFDGSRRIKWNGESVPWGENWNCGDIIGTLIDLDHREILYWRN